MSWPHCGPRWRAIKRKPSATGSSFCMPAQVGKQRMEFKSYYHILAVDRASYQKAISAAYRKLARQYQPDVNKAAGAEEKFKEMNEAYQGLGDADRRARYHQMFDAYQHGA